MSTSSIAVVIVNYRTPTLALDCLRAVDREREFLPSLRAVVVDGGSADDSARILQKELRNPQFVGWTELLALQSNGGFGWANNQAILRLLQGVQPPDYIHLLNPDALIESRAIAVLQQELEAHPEAAACGSLLLDDTGRTLGSAFRFPTPLREFARGLRTAKVSALLCIPELMINAATAAPGEVDWVTGASVMLRSTALRQTGLFDDGFFLYFEEVDLMRRLKCAGWTIRHNPASRVRHAGGAATGVGRDAHNRIRRLPDYWHASRYRFFALAYGPRRALFANAMWLLGHSLWLLRAAVQRRPDVVPNEARDHLRLAWLHRPRCLRASIVPWTASPGTEAAWLRSGR